ncbi:alpha/beta hydrolase-fold protein [Limnoglobus roseus]|uniref:Esterase n=1 Tax=Limnoglobus roseus TaxID=2598579 RepID=A0A5C1A7A0_9BACT|nr:alpha/beta hydrolase-fold protein [Limnoglobus roseus]QEL14315.1 esterase [Limnoglobus roseus]
MLRLFTLVLSLVIVSTASAGIRFEVTADPKLVGDKPAGGRLLVTIGRTDRPPNFPSSDPFALPVLGVDVPAFKADTVATADATALTFPPKSLEALPKGEYVVRAIFAVNRDLNIPTAPGNWTSEPVTVTLDPAAETPVKLKLTKVIPKPTPRDTAAVKYLELPSKLLSEFHKRPMVYRLAVVLPGDFENSPAKKYPLLVHIGGFGTRFTSARSTQSDDRFVQILLDGAGPFGDPYQVNSANNGPYGDALLREVIPHVEKAYRCVGTPKARFVTGGSTGGWVSLALQVFYPDDFNGCWSLFPDGVDFRAFELIDIYKDENAYVNRFGFERPAKRTIDGDTAYTVRHECHLERVLGRGGRWELSGLDWASWNAIYGPRGTDGLPKPLWDGATGKIDKSVLAHWEQYDLRKVLETNWPTLGPKLAGGKVHVWVGDADDYFLNNAVHRLKAAADKFATPKFDGVIEIQMRKGHGGGWPRKDMLAEMLKRAE